MNDFRILYRTALEAIQKYDDASEQEPYFLAVLNYIKTHPDETSTIKTELCGIIENGPVIPFELLGFCMHELKWPEVFSAAQRRLDKESNNPHGRRLAELILESFDPRWDCQVLYKHFQGESINEGRGADLRN